MSSKHPTVLALCILIVGAFGMAASASAERVWFREDHLLLRTETLRLSIKENSFCDPARGPDSARLSGSVILLFKPDGFTITDSEAYRKVLLTDVLPAVRSVCGPVRELVIHNFLNIFFDKDGHEYSDKPPVDALPISIVRLWNGEIKEWAWFNTVVAGHLGSLSPPLEISPWDLPGDSRLSTVNAIRSWFAQGGPEQVYLQLHQMSGRVSAQQEAAVEAELAKTRLERELFRLDIEAADHLIVLDTSLWITKAKNGNAEAMYQLAVRHYRGAGGLQSDNVWAYVFLSLAKKNGYTGGDGSVSTLAAKLRERLSPAERSRADQLALEFPHSYKVQPSSTARTEQPSYATLVRACELSYREWALEENLRLTWTDITINEWCSCISTTLSVVWSNEECQDFLLDAVTFVHEASKNRDFSRSFEFCRR